MPHKKTKLPHKQILKYIQFLPSIKKIKIPIDKSPKIKYSIGSITNQMEIIKLIPENQTLDECINIFRESLLDLGYANSSRVEVFLITKDKFEKIWNVLFHDKDVSEFDEVKEKWQGLIEKGRVILASSDASKSIDNLDHFLYSIQSNK